MSILRGFANIEGDSMVLWIGSGANRELGYPSWLGLAGKLLPPLQAANIAATVNHPIELFSQYEQTFGRNRLISSIEDEFRKVKKVKNPLIVNICQYFSKEYIVTTNYDFVIENSISALQVIRKPRDIPYTNPKMRKLLKIHGDFTDYDFMVVTENDYANYPIKQEPFARLIYSLLESRTIVFVGYSISDLNILDNILQLGARYGNIARKHVVVSTNWDTDEISRAERRGLKVDNISVPFGSSQSVAIEHHIHAAF